MLGLSRQSSKSAATLTRIGATRVIEDIFLNHDMDQYLDSSHVKKLKSKVRMEKMGIDEYDGNHDATVRIRENAEAICFQQREQNECGFFSTISVLITLIKKRLGSFDDKFLKYLLSRSLIKSLTHSSMGITGAQLCKLINDDFFQGEKILTFGGNDIKGDKPRITGMLIGGHWIGYLPIEEIMLEPYTAEIFSLKKEHAHLAFDSAAMKKKIDKSLYVDENKLLKYYSLYLRKPMVTTKFKRTLSKIPESNALLPRLRRGESESFIMPREGAIRKYRKKRPKTKKYKKDRTTSKVVSTIKRATKNSLKKINNVLSINKRNKKKEKDKRYKARSYNTDTIDFI